MNSVHLYILYIYLRSKKKKKTVTCFLREVFYSMGLNSSLSSPTSEQVKEKGGGVSRLGLIIRPLLTDYGLKGFPTFMVYPGLERKLLVLFMSSPKSLVTYPPTKR